MDNKIVVRAATSPSTGPRPTRPRPAAADARGSRRDAVPPRGKGRARRGPRHLLARSPVRRRPTRCDARRGTGRAAARGRVAAEVGHGRADVRGLVADEIGRGLAAVRGLVAAESGRGRAAASPLKQPTSAASSPRTERAHGLFRRREACGEVWEEGRREASGEGRCEAPGRRTPARRSGGQVLSYRTSWFVVVGFPF